MSNAVSVVTIPLQTEKWQEDCLDKRFELCRKVYNNMLSYEIKQWQKMTHDHRYMESKKVIDDTYRISDEKEKKQAKKSDAYKEAAQIQKELLMEYGFSEFAFTNKVLEFQRVYSQNVSSRLQRVPLQSQCGLLLRRNCSATDRPYILKDMGIFLPSPVTGNPASVW